MSVRFDTVLNLIWLLLGVLAFAGSIRSTYRRRKLQLSRPWLHMVGAALVIAALFPCISATDDLLRIEQFHGQYQTPYSSQRGQNDDLIRLYQAMEVPLAAVAPQISLTLVFVLLVVIPLFRRIERSAPFESGRSPPVLPA